jgi:hypothetical protein
MLTRRTLLAGCAGSAALWALPAAAAGGSRSFRILRGGDVIGTQSVTVTPQGDQVRVAIQVDIRVRLLGITAYRYAMTNRELWRGGRLMSLNAETDDDGTRDFVKAIASGDRIVVHGSRYRGDAPADAGTTTYWTPAFLSRPVWISTQGGAPLSVRAAPAGPRRIELASGIVEAEGWRISGDLDLALYYSGGEWVANRFEARGEQAEIVAEALGPALSPLFSG